MKILGAIFGLALIAGLFVVWVRMHRAIKGEGSGGLLDLPGQNRKGESLEAFIAAYRKGEVRPEQMSGPANAAPAQNAAAQNVPAPAIAPPPPEPVRRDPFLSPQVKLAYYVCKIGLRDHHVFANIQLGTLYSAGAPDAASLRSTIDLLICNAQMSAVAAIDLADAQAPRPDAAKVEALRTLGIRYLRLSPKSLPRPEDLNALLYRM